MNVEQRLIAALRSTDRVEPSDDLWSRVVHSIQEDRAHRRRVATSTVVVVAVTVGLVAVGLVNLTDATPVVGGHSPGRQIRLPVMQLIETAALVVLVAVLGPAIRRFGRNYATDLWRATPHLATVLLRLLDIAYLLVFSGYILLSARFDLDRSTVWAEQVQELGWRVGGLLLVMGLLHSITIVALPVVALISNSTRVGRPLPRWLVIVLILLAVTLGPPMLMMMIGGIVDP